MSQNKKYVGNSNDSHKSSNPLSATPYKREYGIALLRKIDPDFLNPDELEKAEQAHAEISQLLEGITVARGVNHQDFLEGTVVAQTKEGYFVNIRRKYDAFVSLAEGEGLTVGQEAEFFVLPNPSKEGLTAMSFTMAKGWRLLEAAQTTGESFEAFVFKQAITKHNQKSAGLRIEFKEGLLKGIRGFIPRREVAFGGNLEELVGQSINVKVIKAEPQSGNPFGNLVLRHSECQSVSVDTALSQLEVNTLVEGTVVKLIRAGGNDTQMSALVRLENGFVAMVHRSETVNVNDKLQDLYKEGDKISPAVLRIDHEQKRVHLSLRLAARINRINSLVINTTIEGTVVNNSNKWGYFIAVGGGIQGLLHENDLATVEGSNGRVKEVLALGQTVKVMVLDMEDEGRRLSLGRKQLFEKQQNQ
jgi:ribosomal protein S1